MLRYSSLVMLLASVTVAAPALAQGMAQYRVQELGPQMRPRSEFEQMRRAAQNNPNMFLSGMIVALFQAAPDGRLTRAKADTARTIETANRRARMLGQTLSYDLDGDFSVSSEEATVLRDTLVGQDRAAFETLFATADTDRDGALSAQELAASAAPQRQLSTARTSQLDTLFAFDSNGDDVVTLEELRDGVAALVAGELSDPACGLPPPGAQTEPVFLSAYEGSALSTVAVAGQDVSTTVARLTIEEGTTPLYVVLTSYGSMIWSFDGAVQRVERVVVGSDRHGSGVSGIAKSKVSFVAAPGCLPDRVKEPYALGGRKAAMDLGSTLGKTVQHVVADYTLRTVTLPSGENRPGSPLGDTAAQLADRAVATLGSDDPRRAAIAEETRELRRFHPDGIAPFDVKDVVARNAAAVYQVLPEQAGVIQLLGSGALEPSGRWYRVLRPLPRFPAGLTGAHGESFILAPGVDIPPGDPGHSEVLDEATGACLSGRCAMRR